MTPFLAACTFLALGVIALILCGIGAELSAMLDNANRVLLIANIASISLGIGGIGAMLDASNKPVQFQNIAPTMLDAKTLGAQFSQVVPSFDIVVHFIDDEKIYELCGPLSLGCASAGAPCNVYLPAGKMISAYPNTQSAFWKTPLSDHDDIFAHEFLHCLYPNWHQPWTDAYKKSFTVRKGSGG